MADWYEQQERRRKAQSATTLPTQEGGGDWYEQMERRRSAPQNDSARVGIAGHPAGTDPADVASMFSRAPAPRRAWTEPEIEAWRLESRREEPSSIELTPDIPRISPHYPVPAPEEADGYKAFDELSPANKDLFIRGVMQEARDGLHQQGQFKNPVTMDDDVSQEGMRRYAEKFPETMRYAPSNGMRPGRIHHYGSPGEKSALTALEPIGRTAAEFASPIADVYTAWPNLGLAGRDAVRSMFSRSPMGQAAGQALSQFLPGWDTAKPVDPVTGDTMDRIPSLVETIDAPASPAEAQARGVSNVAGTVASFAVPSPSRSLGMAGKGIAEKVVTRAMNPSGVRPIAQAGAKLAGGVTGFLAGFEAPHIVAEAAREVTDTGEIAGPTGRLANSFTTGGYKMLRDTMVALKESPQNIAKVMSSDVKTIQEGFAGIGPLAVLFGATAAAKGGEVTTKLRERSAQKTDMARAAEAEGFRETLRNTRPGQGGPNEITVEPKIQPPTTGMTPGREVSPKPVQELAGEVKPAETTQIKPDTAQQQGVTGPVAALSPGEAQPAEHKFSSTQINLPESFAAKVRDVSKRIPESELAEDGREVEPHVTVKYGLHTDKADAVRAALANEGPIRVKLGETSIFPASESGKADVVKIDIDSPDLHRLNKKIADAAEHTDTHPDYKPHVTLAYVKAGEGAKYAGSKDFAGEEMTLDRIVFSSKDGTRTEIPLSGKTGTVETGAETVTPIETKGGQRGQAQENSGQSLQHEGRQEQAALHHEERPGAAPARREEVGAPASIQRGPANTAPTAPATPRMEGDTPQERIVNRMARIMEEGPGGEMRGIPITAPRTLNMDGPGKVEVTKPVIIRKLEEIAKSPIRVRGSREFSRRRGLLGLFFTKRHTIQLREALDLLPAMHESGHALHRWAQDMSVKYPKPITDALTTLGRELYPKADAVLAVEEGIAEYVAQRIIGEKPGARFPGLDAWFEKTFNERDPKTIKRMNEAEAMFRQWHEQGAEARVLAQINRGETLTERAKNGVRDFWGKFVRNWYDDLAPVEKLERDRLAEAGRNWSNLPAGESITKVLRVLRPAAPSTARHFILHSAVDLKGNRVGPSLGEIIRKMKSGPAPTTRRNIEQTMAYWYARRAELLWQRGINPGISAADAQHTARKLHTPEREAGLKEATQWGNHLLDYLADAGGLNPKEQAAIEALNPIYIPLQRFFEKEMLGGSGGGSSRGIAGSSKPIKRIKGSGRQIIDPLEAFAMQAEKVISAAHKTIMARTIADFARKVDFSGSLVEKVDIPPQVHKFSLAQVEKQLKAMGVDTTGVNGNNLLNVFTAADRYMGKDNIVGFWRDGKPEFYRLDPELYRVVMDLDKESVRPWMETVIGRTALKSARAVKLGAVTLSPDFALFANPVRDAFTWAVQTVTKKKGARGVNPLDDTPLHSLFGGLWQQLTHDKAVDQWRALGGEMATMLGQDRIAAKSLVNEAMVGTKGEKVVHAFRHPVEAMRAAGQAFEANPRVVEFKRVFNDARKRKGWTDWDALIEASAAAQDVTVNFTRFGVATRAFNQLFPFFNAKQQGASKFARVFGGVLSGDKMSRRQAMKATAKAFEYVTLPTLALWWINHDEEWYKARPRWERMNYWMFSPNDGKTIIRIPRPFEIGHVFGTLPEAAMEKAYGEGEESRRNIDDALWATFKSFTPISSIGDALPAILKPAVETATNKDFFRDKPIDSERDVRENVPSKRFDEYTTETAKAIASALRVAPDAVRELLTPRKIEHLLSGYTGGAGLDALRWTESMLGLRSKTREFQMQDAPIIGRAFGRPAGTIRTQQLMDFYDQLADLRQKKGSDELSEDEARRLEESESLLSERIEDRREIRAATGQEKTKLQRAYDQALDEEIRRLRILEAAK